MDARPPEIRDLPALARERVQMGPAPDWIVPCPYDADFKAKVRGPITELLIEQQIHAELHQIYVRRAVRLETMQAVQHWSQWRLEFEPQTQSLLLHSIRTRRGSTETEHATPGRIQFLQREAGLEGCIIDGWVTLLLLLEDVAPGDVLEWSYTLTSHPRLLREHAGSFYTLPPGASVGKYHFSVRHAEQRPLQWKSSGAEFTPVIETAGTEKRCVWQGEKFLAPEPEEGTPPWKLDFPWIQISDCAHWQTVAQAVIAAWNEAPPGDGLSKLTEEITNAAPDLPARANRAIELVQDRFRYLSVGLELGGQIPAAPETVIRRRYGDCKDLAFLLVHLLRALGIPARPVLVHSEWRRSLSDMLPSPAIFNHAIVEYEIGDQKLWVDATFKAQGGALKRTVPDFGLGLPIDAAVTGLAPVPKASLASASYELKESYILDTSGNPSCFAVLVTARGAAADGLRLDFDNEGVEAIARKTLQHCADRFSRAARIGQLEYRDDRENNEFVFAEVFEIDGFLKHNEADETCLFLIQSEPTAGMLALPPAAPRRNPFALPFPCSRVHTIEIDFAGFDGSAPPPFQTGTRYFTFSRRSKTLRNFLRLTFSLNTLADSIPPEHVPEHRRHVEEIWQESGLTFLLPTGYMRMVKGRDFGALPGRRTGASAPPSVQTPPAPIEKTRVTTAPAKPQKFVDPTSPPAEGRRSSRRRRSRGHGLNRICLAAFGVFLLSFLLLAISFPLARQSRDLAGLLGFLSIFGWVASLSLGGWGWRQCVRQPEKYPRGKSLAQITVTTGGLLAVLIVPLSIAAITGVLEPVDGSRGELLKFEPYNFVFYSPRQPWAQTDARAFGEGTVLAFAHPERKFFRVSLKPMETTAPDIRARVVAECLENLRGQAISCQVLREGEATHNGIAGWQTESRANIQGHDYHLVHWILATNGFGYQLVVWGPAAEASDVKTEAGQMFANFELARKF